MSNLKKILVGVGLTGSIIAGSISLKNLQSASATLGKRISYGTGSGKISITSNSSVNANNGDTVVIKGGTYSGGTITGITGLTIINDSTPVKLTSSLTIGGWNNSNLVGVNGYGFSFSNVSGTVHPLASGQMYHSGIYNVEYLNCGQIFHYDNAQGGTYNGTDSTTFMINQFTLSGLHLSGCQELWYGTWDGLSTSHSFVYGLNIYKLKVDNLLSSGMLVWGNGIFGFDYSDWNITGATPNSTGDVGLVQGAGNGKMHSIYINGCRGYLTRWQSSKLNGIGDTKIYNNIKLNTTCYGLADVRADAGTYGGVTTPGDVWVVNNTQINNQDCFNGQYTTAAAVIFPHASSTVYAENNLNLACTGSQTNGIYDDTQNQGTTVLTTNYQGNSANGIADATTGFLVSGSPVISKGTSISWRTEDFNHNAASTDIGATSFKSTPVVIPVPPVISTSTSSQTITLPTNSVSLIATAKDTNVNGSITSTVWSKVSGPTNYTLSSGNTLNANVSSLVQGTYIFTLTVTNNNNLSSSLNDTVIVNPVPVITVPGVTISSSYTIPTISLTANGITNTPVAVKWGWGKISGPGKQTITNAYSKTCTVTGLQAGQYVFKVTVWDANGNVGSQTVSFSTTISQ